MSNTLVISPEITSTQAEKVHNTHRFFDPRLPEQPSQIFGLDTQAVLQLGRAVTALGVLPPKANLGLYALPDAVRLVPLLETMQSGTALTPEDVRPYRKPIKRLSPDISFADKLAATAGAVAVGIPIRRALNCKIEREFPSRASAAIEQAREALALIENDVDYIASIENPKKQFETELSTLAQTVSESILQQRDVRVQRGVPEEVKLETPRGLAGFFVKAVRKIRSFFGIFKHREKVNSEVTAYDAGSGIEKTIRSLTKDQQETTKQFPLLSKLLFDRLPKKLSVSKDHLAFLAPELLNFFFSASPKSDGGKDLIASVVRNPHELRFVTKFKKRYGRYSLDSFQRASTTLMPAIKNVLPTEGAQIRTMYDQVRDFLQQNQQQEESKQATVPDDKTPKKRLRDRLKATLRRSRK